MGINLERDHQGIRCLTEKEYIIRKLKEHMPEMLRIEGYDVNMQPILSIDYFAKYIDAVFDVARHPPKPSGHYLFNEQGYRVLVDEQGIPVKPGGVKERGIDHNGKMFVKETYRL
jgi:hypothetical protein